MTPQRAEHAEAVRSSLERLSRLVDASAHDELASECRELKRALGLLAGEVDGLAAERAGGAERLRGRRGRVASTRRVRV